MHKASSSPEQNPGEWTLFVCHQDAPRQPICQCDVSTPAHVLFASGGFCTLDLLWTWPPEVTIWEFTCWGGFKSLRPGLEDTLRYSSLQSSLRAPTCSPTTSACALEATGFSKEAFSTNPMHTGTHAASHGLLYRTQPGLLNRGKRADSGLQGQVPKRHSPEWSGRRRRPVLGEDACADQTHSFPE